MSSKFYYELEIAFNSKNYESIYNHLYISGIKNIVEEKGTIKISIEDSNDESGINVLEKIKNDLIKRLVITKNDVSLTKLDNLNWNKEWEKSIEPVFINDRIIIYPSWKKNVIKNEKNKILIEIDPKMSFGTGHNETTRLILELMSDYITGNDKYMLDFGCGTGILAIAGIKLGLEKAIAIDIDEDSIENAEEYFKINKVEDKIKIYKSDIKKVKESEFDLIAANITSNIIILNLKTMYKKLKKNGKIFLTGILRDEIDEIAKQLALNKFEIEEIRNKAEWSSFYALKIVSPSQGENRGGH
jgi:ribosomal protein L11 methyltransferase